MKKTFLSTLLLSLLLAACTGPFQKGSDSQEESNPIQESTSSETETESECESETESVESEQESESELYPDSDLVPAEGTVELYAINDLHGAIVPNPDNYEMGILKVGSYLKQRQQEENTVVLNGGDFWQGSIHSNINYGQFLTEVGNEIEFDSMTIGNHEFDWGVDYIKRNAELVSDTGYKTPLLGANIYNYNMETDEVGSYANIGQKYVVKTLENGIKVGIIGLIGTGQITSITSSYVDDLTFIDPFKVVKELSTELREEKGCHVVVLSAHESVASIATLSDGGSKNISNYVDVIFGAHTHQNEDKLYNNKVPGLQGSYNGRSISKISITVDIEGNITLNEKVNIKDSTMPQVTIDQEIQEIYDKYMSVAYEKANESLMTFNGTMSKSNAPYLMTSSIADYALEQGHDISYAIVNGARSDLGSDTNITYEDLYKAFPFDNEVYIMEVNGWELKTNLNRNYFYRLDPQKIDENKKYTCAIIDYVATHRNNIREYDNFTDFRIIDSLKKDGNTIFNYREICAHWLRNLNIESMDISYFQGSNLRHNKSSITSNVTLPNNPYVG